MYGRVLDASDGQFTVCDTHVDCWGVINLFNNWISISLLLACSVASSCLVLFLCGRLGPGNLCIGSSLRLNFLNNTSLRPVRLHSWRRFFIHCPVSDLTYPCPILHLFPLSCWRRYVAWGSDERGGTDPWWGSLRCLNTPLGNSHPCYSYLLLLLLLLTALIFFFIRNGSDSRRGFVFLEYHHSWDFLLWGRWSSHSFVYFCGSSK